MTGYKSIQILVGFLMCFMFLLMQKIFINKTQVLPSGASWRDLLFHFSLCSFCFKLNLTCAILTFITFFKNIIFQIVY